MQVTKMYCDICGTEINSNNNRLELKGYVIPSGTNWKQVNLELCDECVSCFWNTYFLLKDNKKKRCMWLVNYDI